MRRALLPVGLVFAAALGGCGFTPLYATPGVSEGLTHIDVIAPGGRQGYLLREALDDTLGHAKGAQPLYRLEMNISEGRAGHGLTVTDVSQRFEIDLVVNYTLKDAATDKVVKTGRVASQISYDSTNQPYAGIAARQSTQELVANDAANKIQLQLAAWMAAGKPAPPTPTIAAPKANAADPIATIPDAASSDTPAPDGAPPAGGPAGTP